MFAATGLAAFRNGLPATRPASKTVWTVAWSGDTSAGTTDPAFYLLPSCAAVSPHQQGTVFAHVRSIEGVPRAGPARPDTWNALAQAFSLQTLHGPSEAQVVGASNRALPSADGGIPGAISTRAGE